ncbi:MAG: TSUP family transporter [Acidaminococcales bacterium]|nr:TSUP family transporter [Acidaminococcales bacterium]
MANVDLWLLIFLVFAGFVASVIDSAVGGGGLIMVPAFMLTGLEPVAVLGTNKLAAVMGAFAGAATFWHSGKTDPEILRCLFPTAFIGSVFGVYTVHLISSEFLRPLVVAMLVIVTIYSVTRKNWGARASYAGMKGKRAFLTAAAVFALGFYDGFFGPGTGSFLLFFFLCLGFDFVGAAANARVLNFASNMAAAISFSFLGLANYFYALPVGISMVLGSFVGARMAIHKGAAYVRPLFVFITVLLIGKQIWEMWGK